MEVDFDISEAVALAAHFQAAGVAAPERASAIVRHYGGLLHTAVVARAPGTNYPDTIKLENVSRGSFAGVSVTTDRPDGFRRELGFHGLDSKRRMYNQAGTPHFGPGFAAVAPAFEAALRRMGES